MVLHGRAAKEDGVEFCVLAEVATLTFSERNLTLRSEGAVLLHVGLGSVLLAASETQPHAKLMVVPCDRSPAYLIECKAEQLIPAVAALRARGLAVETPRASSSAAPEPMPIDGKQLELLAASSRFRAILAGVEGALAQRRSLGEPDLLPSA